MRGEISEGLTEEISSADVLKLDDEIGSGEQHLQKLYHMHKTQGARKTFFKEILKGDL